jgi:hypothetical protein
LEIFILEYAGVERIEDQVNLFEVVGFLVEHLVNVQDLFVLTLKPILDHGISNEVLS